MAGIRKKAQVSSDVRPAYSTFVFWMEASFVYWYLFKVKRTDSFQTGHIDPELIGF